MTALVVALVVSVLAVAFGVFWMITRRHRPDGHELAVVAEIPETGILGGLLVALGFVMIGGKMAGMPIGGTGATADTFAAVFGVVLVLAGVEVLLMCLVKRTIAYPDRLVSFNSFGADRAIPWGKIVSVKVQPMSRRATFKSADDSISVDGRRADYVELVQVAIAKVPPLAASDDLARLLRTLAR